MRNDRLVRPISDCDALTQHLDQDYREGEESVRAMWNLVQQLVDLNYSPEGLEEVLDWEDGFTMADVERRLMLFRETDTYRELAGMKWPLLSEDVAGFRRLAKLSRDYADGARPRPDIELPRLRQFAVEIQALIDAEYR
jgi:hypothetical protein